MRDEEAPPNTVEMARRKALTSRMFNTTTADFQKNTMPDSPRAGQRDVPQMLALSGGVPVKIGKEIIGTVGSSGSGLEADDALRQSRGRESRGLGRSRDRSRILYVGRPPALRRVLNPLPNRWRTTPARLGEAGAG